jgi:hypothetical protein
VASLTLELVAGLELEVVDAGADEDDFVLVELLLPQAAARMARTRGSERLSLLMEPP